MNIQKMITELQAEKERLDEAIGALERLSAGNKAKRRPRAERPAAGGKSTDADVPHSGSR